MNFEYANDNPPETDVTMNDFFFRIGSLIVLAILCGALLAQTGCTMPKTVNFAPLISVEDSANGNTVPVSAAP